MMEEILITARANPKVDPVLAIWNWEIPIYLFVGGLTAGILFFAGLMILLGRQQQAWFATRRLPLLAPIVLSLGMLMLFLDLEHKLWVWRFYTSFQPTSPMSWGSWVLIFVYPASLLLILSYLREGYPALAALLQRLPLGGRLMDLSEDWRRPVAWASLLLGVFLGIYTGVLLSAFNARPFWNTAMLGPLFLVSGLSTAAAAAVLGGRKTNEGHFFTRIDIGLIILELVIIALLLINLATGGARQLQALSYIMGGDYTLIFWVGFVGLGLLLPLVLEGLSLKRSSALVTLLPPLLILAGGYLLRDITVDVGQQTGWTHYEQQYNPELLDEIRAH
jgi:formate-dependent nitrite reductase membrane component NrfD